MEMFQSLGHVVMQPPNGGVSFAQMVCGQLGLTFRIDVTTFAFSSLTPLVRGTQRMALVQRSLAERMCRLGGIRIAALPFDLPLLEQSVQWHSYRSRDPALVWVREQLAAATREVHGA